MSEHTKNALQFLRTIKAWPEDKLRRYHTKVFEGTEWEQRIPKYIYRDVIERRLWFYYQIKFPKYAAHTPEYEKVWREASSVLLKQMEPTDSQELRAKLEDRANFSEKAVRAMPIEEVDQCLAVLGITFTHATELARRAALHDAFYSEARKGCHEGKEKVTKEMMLRNIITAHPYITWAEFQKKYGTTLSDVTHVHFRVTKWRLRKSGAKVGLGVYTLRRRKKI